MMQSPYQLRASLRWPGARIVGDGKFACVFKCAEDRHRWQVRLAHTAMEAGSARVEQCGACGGCWGVWNHEVVVLEPAYPQVASFRIPGEGIE
jgi:hypothetical protein